MTNGEQRTTDYMYELYMQLV